MDDELALEMLKINLDILQVDNKREKYLKFLIQSAKDVVEHKGIVLNNTEEDINIIVMYAAYLYRRRAASDDIRMPEMLKVALRNRIVRCNHDA